MTKRPLPPDFFPDPMPGISDTSAQTLLTLVIPNALEEALDDLALFHKKGRIGTFKSLLKQAINLRLHEDLPRNIEVPTEHVATRHFYVTPDIDAELEGASAQSGNPKTVIAVRLLQMAIDKNFIPQ